jgi:single-stranded DNA-binding protein
MGNLTRDPEIRYGSGAERAAVCKFGLAVNR